MSLLENRKNETFKMWMKVRQVKVAFLVEEDDVMQKLMKGFSSRSTQVPQEATGGCTTQLLLLCTWWTRRMARLRNTSYAMMCQVWSLICS